MKGVIFGQTCYKYLKLLAFFMTIMRGSCEEWIELNLTHVQHYNPYLTLGILCKDMFVRHSLTSFLHFLLSANVSERLSGNSPLSLLSFQAAFWRYRKAGQERGESLFSIRLMLLI